MRHLLFIAFITVLMVLAGPLTADDERAAVQDSATTAPDSVTAAGADARDSVYNVRLANPAARFNPTALTETDIYRADAAGLAEIMRYRALTSVSIPFTLSSSLNRVLPYGNVIPGHLPATDFTPLPSAPFFYISKHYWNGGMVSLAQAADISLDPYHGFMYLPYPGALTKPEFVIFWENGVFNQNTLSLRLTRPLSRSIMINLFSNYRYFDGKPFSHDRSNITDFYEFFYSDTSKMVSEGYNPLVDEHALGGSILHTGADSSRVYASFTYTGQINEYALNTTAPPSNPLSWGMIDRSSYRIDAAKVDKKVGSAEISIRTAFASEALAVTSRPVIHVPATTDTSQLYCLVADATLTLSSGLGITAGTMLRSIENLGDTNQTFHEYHAEIFYSRLLNSLSTRRWQTDIHLRSGAVLNPSSGSIMTFVDKYDNEIFKLSPKFGASIEYASKKADRTRMNLYVNLDPLPTLGIEGQTQWQYLGLLLGYQGTPQFDPDIMWPHGIPPYQQPYSTIIIAPWTSRIGGFALMSKTFITDTKPHIKTSTSLSHIYKPGGMSHTFETELGFDYWSERDPVNFAGLYGWDDPIYDLNLKITAHIKSFRLFYKVDNLLNMRNAYVPGYFSPGLTFRWGLNWFIM